MLNVVMLNVIMLNVIMLNVIMLNVVMLNVFSYLSGNFEFYLYIQFCFCIYLKSYLTKLLITRTASDKLEFFKLALSSLAYNNTFVQECYLSWSKILDLGKEICYKVF